jgi:hypothetical protein
MKQLRFFEIASGSQAPLGNPLIAKLFALMSERKCCWEIACSIVLEVRSRSFSYYPVPKQSLGTRGKWHSQAKLGNELS